jgi:outer membrane receptor protein involved in Fe transport
MLALGGAGRLNAQGATASISGTVLDSSGAAIPAAALEIRNTGTGAKQETATDSQGRFLFPDLAIGDYEIQASRTGFQTVVRKGITLDVGRAPVVDFQLPVGSAEQTVNVDSAVSQVETTTSSVSSLVNQTQMRELPLNGRNFEQLVLLAPGAVAYTAGPVSALIGRNSTFSVAGARPEGAAILLDGENLQNWWQRGSGAGVTGTSLGIEAIAEFQTLTNTYGADFGGNGAVINAATKSGTNSYHGSAYDFLRNSKLDARNFFESYVAPGDTTAHAAPFRKNQFGGSIGGPIKKDKLFFFGNYEGIRQLQGQVSKNFVPSADIRATATPTMAPVVALYPLPTVDLGNGTGYLFQSANQIAQEDYFLGRLDYTMSDKDTVFLRYLSDRGGLINPGLIPLWPTFDNSKNQFVTLQERHTFSSTLVNTFSTSFSQPTSGEKQPSTTPELQIFPGQNRQDTFISVPGLTSLGAGIVSNFQYTQNKFTQSDDVIWTKGSHTIKIGAKLRNQRMNYLTTNQYNGNWSFTSLTNFLSGNAFSVVYVPPGGANGRRHFRDTALAPYVQDDWKVSRRLTLNLGIRYEWQSNPTEADNLLHNVINPPFGTFDPVPNAFVTNPNKNNWDPRFGFAYDIFGDHKTSIRGGFAIMHDPYQTYVFASAAGIAPPYVLLTAQTTNTQPLQFPSGISTAAGGLVSTTNGTDYNIRTTPYQIQWNLNIQRELFKGSVLTVGYIGSRGVHLLAFHDFNPPIATRDASGVYHFGTGSTANPRINPNLSTLDELDPVSSSKFHALQTSFTQRFGSGFQGNLSYMFSKCTDQGYTYAGLGGNAGSSSLTNPYDFSIDQGLCVTNIHHNLVVNVLYTLPFHGNRFKEGWQITGIETYRTGLPYTITTGFDRSLISNTFDQTRPNVVAGCDITAGQSVAHWFNSACFALQDAGTIGNAGRSIGTSPGYVSTDFSLTKDTRINEQFRAQLRAELFNIFNHTNLGLPASGAFTATGPAANAGAITTIIGNSRQIQFGLKLLF